MGKGERMKSYCFRDPARIYEDKESRSCKGCRFEGSEPMFGKIIKFCRKKKRHGLKCSLFALPETAMEVIGEGL